MWGTNRRVIMTQLKLNKAFLSLEQRNLKNYKKYLPSLELKRKKLLSESSGLEEQMLQLQEKEQSLKKNIQTNFPMANNYLSMMQQFIKIEQLDIGEENIVGIKLPVLNSIQWTISEYAYLNTPHWFDALIDSVTELLELRLRIKITTSRAKLLDKAIQTVTQRKNLFEKILIPNAINHIKLIQIFLADNERASVVRSKIAKKKRWLL